MLYHPGFQHPLYAKIGSTALGMEMRFRLCNKIFPSSSFLLLLCFSGYTNVSQNLSSIFFFKSILHIHLRFHVVFTSSLSLFLSNPPLILGTFIKLQKDFLKRRERERKKNMAFRIWSHSAPKWFRSAYKTSSPQYEMRGCDDGSVESENEG